MTNRCVRACRAHPGRALRSALISLAFVLTALSAVAQSAPPPLSNQARLNTNVQNQANAVLAIMSYTTVPDVTTSSLSINSGTTDNPGFGQTQPGGGFTISRTFPLYLEGTLAASRYDPTFVATDGATQRLLPIRWNTASTTVGIGRDFPITDELNFQPILNGTIGRVASDLRAEQSLLNHVAASNLQFLDEGALNACGYGGLLMLGARWFDMYSDTTSTVCRSESPCVLDRPHARRIGLPSASNARWRFEEPQQSSDCPTF